MVAIAATGAETRESVELYRDLLKFNIDADSIKTGIDDDGDSQIRADVKLASLTGPILKEPLDQLATGVNQRRPRFAKPPQTVELDRVQFVRRTAHMTHCRSRITASSLALALAVGVLACSPAIRSTLPQPPTPQQLSQFWIDTPVESRDLFAGPGDPSVPPRPNATLLFVKDDTTGFSRKVVVKDEAGTKWHVKLGPEAQPEVVSSRLVWALGYHQLPQYVVGRWVMRGGELGGTMPAGRFRRDEPGYKNVGNWSWHENPFVGTQPYRGLLVLMAMLNNSDMKPEQNRIYEVANKRELPERIYVVSDLGLSWGASGIEDPKRGDIDAFEKQGFIKRIDGNHVVIDQRNLRAELFDQITVSDLRWIGERMSRLSDKQWHDLFRAAAYEDDALVNRFIARMKQKINQALRAQPDAAN